MHSLWLHVVSLLACFSSALVSLFLIKAPLFRHLKTWNQYSLWFFQHVPRLWCSCLFYSDLSSLLFWHFSHTPPDMPHGWKVTVREENYSLCSATVQDGVPNTVILASFNITHRKMLNVCGGLLQPHHMQKCQEGLTFLNTVMHNERFLRRSSLFYYCEKTLQSEMIGNWKHTSCLMILCRKIVVTGKNCKLLRIQSVMIMFLVIFR